MIPENEYLKLLRAIRISGSLLVLNSGWAAFSAARKIPLAGEQLENLIVGGRDNFRGGIVFLLEWQSTLTWSVLLGTAAALFILWLTRRLPGAVLTLGVSVALLGIFQSLVEAEITRSLREVISRFQGM